MSTEVTLNSPLADALTASIQPKLVEIGWGSGGADDTALAEYIVLMLVNGKSEDQVAAELSNDLLSLGPDDPGAQLFARWLFEQIPALNASLGGAPLGAQDVAGGPSQDGAAAGDQDMDMMASTDASELNAPTGPRSMRNGNPLRGGRDKRMLGQMTKAMDRTHDSALHRVRGQTGNERINSHSRGPPTGPRGGFGRGIRNDRAMNNRTVNIQAGLSGMAGMGGPGGPGGPGAMGVMGAMGAMNGNWQMPGQGPMELFAMLEQQSRIMEQLTQAINVPQQNGRQYGNQRQGKSLFDRVGNRGRGGFHQGRGQHHQQSDRGEQAGAEAEGAEGEDVDMGVEKREPPNPDETICKFNLRCTNKDCKFAHQSPAAPQGTHIDVHDVCTFGAACKNRKCVGRHPSPAARLAHQSEQDCKFFPNCQNPNCTFRHPAMPLCRNGADCTAPNCKFTHVRTKCRFNPCLKRGCAFAHEAGQQGGFKDKVWQAEDEHVSERKFVDEEAEEEVIIPDAENHSLAQEQSGIQEVIG